MDDITECPHCGSSDISVEPIMRGSQDGSGLMTYWRCGGCNAIISNYTMRDMADRGLYVGLSRRGEP